MINGKQYIGSSVDLYNRLLFYFSFSAMENHLKNNQSYIYNALLKHGHENFSLTILEYCEPEQCIFAPFRAVSTHGASVQIIIYPF